ncbi:3-isopropylmalate dehydratase small subunit, partial [Klebsiella pneumoniae]|nr:3-isopropylmalate dehydratase small subunit [Klebsiella pneumoniae]
EEIDPNFVKRVQPGDVIVAGKNFGQGSGREQAPLGLIGLGVGCIIATSFARTFFRMAVDLGLHTVECPEAFKVAKD